MERRKKERKPERKKERTAGCCWTRIEPIPARQIVAEGWLTGQAVLFQQFVVFVADLFGVLDRQVVHLGAYAFHRRFGRFRQVRLALTLAKENANQPSVWIILHREMGVGVAARNYFEMSQSLLEVVVGGSNGPSQPLKRIFHVPFHYFATLGAHVPKHQQIDSEWLRSDISSEFE